MESWDSMLRLRGRGQVQGDDQAMERLLLQANQMKNMAGMPGGRGAAQTDDDLVRWARDGDDGAFRMLVERYQDRVAATVIGMLGRGGEADDVGQETFIRFYRALGNIRGESTLGTYLTRIAMNLCFDAVRRHKKRRFWFRMDQDEETLPAELIIESNADVESVERRERVQRSIGTLDAKHRAVVVLRMINGYSTRETAELLHIPEGTVLSRLSRAQEKLRHLLQPLMDD
jgi:RNA polymerase sigma-70 factor (ECF subfamily)